MKWCKFRLQYMNDISITKPILKANFGKLNADNRQNDWITNTHYSSALALV